MDSSSNNTNVDVVNTSIAILLDTANKYEPGMQPFRLQSLVGLQENDRTITKTKNNHSNIMNEDISKLPLGDYNSSSVIKMEVPFEISRRYPVKFIPPGTRFIVTFSSGDITKPRIVGGEF